MRDYELGIVVSPESSEEQTKAILDRVTQIVQSNNGQVVKVNAWGRRRLAYPIERHRDGLYFFLDLSLTPPTVLEIDRVLKVTEEVIRHLLIKRDPKALAMQRAKEATVAVAPEQPEVSLARGEPLAQAAAAEEAPDGLPDALPADEVAADEDEADDEEAGAPEAENEAVEGAEEEVG
jgi:small subunit ribosomal protein S6